ncbi:hypothetical protein [Actinomadura sp. NEAU-AAG7]|uniref:hypothetical protein n=1 Tax=Actinomadura sp. NEAU-AAG7 TaxID=2839640 RepID=UPI001BE3D6D5|nr:hypothetical protein [Actinomadura sp. NEAU-AAG7]MBT2208206.1 hypothetical protein [Actinomadura sp. NEAU-AAG7]
MVANLGRTPPPTQPPNQPPNQTPTQPPPARRGTRRRRRRESALVWWGVFAVFAVAAWMLGSWPVALLGLLAWCLYQFMLVPTFCRARTREGHYCTERARGRLFACGPSHQQAKVDALWKLVGLRNPFRAGSTDTAKISLEPADRVLVLLAAAGTVVTLIGMVYGF